MACDSSLLCLNAQANSFPLRLFNWLPGRLELGKPCRPQTAPVTQLEKQARSQYSLRRIRITTAQWNGNEPAHKGDKPDNQFLRRCWAHKTAKAWVGGPGIWAPTWGACPQPPPSGGIGKRPARNQGNLARLSFSTHPSPFCHFGAQST